MKNKTEFYRRKMWMTHGCFYFCFCTVVKPFYHRTPDRTGNDWCRRRVQRETRGQRNRHFLSISRSLLSLSATELKQLVHSSQNKTRSDTSSTNSGCTFVSHDVERLPRCKEHPSVIIPRLRDGQVCILEGRIQVQSGMVHPTDTRAFQSLGVYIIINENHSET